ncbi:MAG: hypothetical protein JW860_14955 [Sedimentisphaerales bacterium]|nr:hypothetical protein [Sedimentisphaerales bacterium]
MKIGKVLKVTGFVIVVIIVALVVAFYLFGSKAVRLGIEVGGTKALKVPVAVEAVDLSLLAGRAGVKNLVVDNPSGYQNEKMLELGEARVDLAMGTVLSDTIHIDEILMNKMSVVLEQRGLTNNIQEVLDGMAKEETEPETEPGEKKQPESAGKNLVINKLEISEVAVKVKLLPVPGKKDTITMKLAPITMTDLGKEGKVDFAVLAGKILVAIAEGIVQQGVGILPDDIIGPMGDTLNVLGASSEVIIREAGKVLDGSLESTDKLIDESKKLGDGLKKGLGGLLDSKKDDKEKE